jgi:ABC-type phosphate transport system substrate-binding protein
MRKTIRVTGAVAAAAAGALALSMVVTGPASADPSFTPDADDIVGVGSNTTEFLMQALADKFNADGIGGAKRMASFNAEGSATIVLRQGSSPITRPNGSSAGIDELQANPDVSFARSSRGPGASGDEGTSFYPYAKDKLSYVYAKPTSNVDPNLAASDLFDIYTCGKTDWSDFGQPAGHIQALVPQAGSGTRSFFLASIGETEAQLQAAIAQPDGVCSVTEVEEHNPKPIEGKPNALAPFSGARFHTLAPKDKKKLTYAADQGAPFNVTRNVYNVIRTADASSLDQFFNTSSWLCKSAAAKKIITQQGFSKLAKSDCGVPLIQ